MEIIDLRDYVYNGDNIIERKNDFFIFYNVEKISGEFERVFYKYDLTNKDIEKINKSKILTSDEACYVHYIENNFLYTTSYVEDNNELYSYIWKINLNDGECTNILEMNGNIEFKFLNSKYVIAKGSKFGIDKNYLDEKKLAQGEYDYAYLVDMTVNKKYPIKDKKLFWGLNDNLFLFDNNNKLFLEEVYMDVWELKDAYDMDIKKENIYKEGYKESINIINMDLFLEEIKEGKEKLSFEIIERTEYNASVRYFGHNESEIFYRKHNFENNSIEIYKYLINDNITIKIKDVDLLDYLYRGLYYSNEDQKIFYEDNFSEKIRIKEIVNNSLDIELEDEYEEYVNLLEGKYLVTNICEEEDEENIRYYVIIKDLLENKMEKFQGFCEFIGNSIVLFA